MHSCKNDIGSFKCIMYNTDEKSTNQSVKMSPVNLHFSNTTCATDMLNTYSFAIEEHLSKK